MYTDLSILMSVKFQITLPEPLMAALKRESQKSGVSVAELIRQSVAERLHRKPERAWRDPFHPSAWRDRSQWMDGLATSDETDLAARVDEVLYGEGVPR